jgi:hypothetical protein
MTTGRSSIFSGIGAGSLGLAVLTLNCGGSTSNGNPVSNVGGNANLAGGGVGSTMRAGSVDQLTPAPPVGSRGLD